MPKVSVIIPVYNDAQGLQDTLVALQAQTYPVDKLEIIVVDNNSQDGSDQVALHTSGVQLMYEKEVQNAGAARNKGLSVATGEIIAFTDANCIPAPNWIAQAVNILQTTQVDRLAGEVQISPISPNSSIPALLDTLYNFNQEHLVNTYQACVTANLIIKREVFTQIGLFCPNFFEFEDLDWGRRASAAGFSLLYAPDCVVSHPPRSTAKEIWQKGVRCGRGVFSICLQEQRGGVWGWKHFARIFKLLLSWRRLHWHRLPFPPSQLTLGQKLQIYLWRWVAINLGETVGYIQWGLFHRS